MDRRKSLVEQQLALLIRALQLLEPPASEGRRGGSGSGGAQAAEPLWQRLAAARRLDSKQVQTALHLLYVRLYGRAAAKKEFRGCWPIAEAAQQKEFKGAAQAWVRGLAAGDRLPPQSAQFFVTAYQSWGARTVELLFHLALLALEAELERGYPDAAPPAPMLQVPSTCGTLLSLQASARVIRGTA